MGDCECQAEKLSWLEVHLIRWKVRAGLWSKMGWMWVPAVPLTNCVSLDK